MAKKSNRHLGTFFQPRETSKRETGQVLGADIAVAGLIEHLILNHSSPKFTFIVSHRYLENARRSFDSLINKLSNKGPIIECIGYDSFFQDHSPPQINILLNLVGGKTERDGYLRSNHMSYPYSIAAVIHSHGYPEQLHSEFLYKILASEPFDTQICVSQASRVSLSKTFDFISKRLSKMLKTKVNYRGRFDVLPPWGFDPEYFKPRDPAPLRDQFKIPRDAFVILWFGRMSISDKMDLVPSIRVFDRLRKANPKKKLVLVLASSGSVDGYDEWLQKYVTKLGMENMVMIRTDIKVEERNYLYNCADVFISPSDNVQETFGITPIEAMASGVPQVVSAWDGYRENIVDEVTGFLIPTYWMKCDDELNDLAGVIPWFDALQLIAQSCAMDMEIYEQRLQLLISNESLRRKMGESSRQHALETFSWKKVVNKYEDLFSDLESIQRTPVRSPKFLQYNRTEYFDIFSNYASDLLSSDHKIELTDSGMKLKNGQEKIPLVSLFGARYFKPEIFSAILDELFPKGAPRSASISTLDKRVASSSHENRGQIRRHLLWLLKYGFVRNVKKKRAPV